MSKDSKTSIGWRLFWGVLGAGLAFVVLSVSGWGLPLPAVIGISAGVGVAAALGGPILLDLLSLA